MTNHVQSFHFQPFLSMQELEKTVRTFARDDKHFLQTFTVFQLFYLTHYIHLHPDEITTRGKGASAQRVFPKWADEYELIFFFSPRVCLRIHLKTLIQSTHPQQRIGVLEMYSQAFSSRVRITPSISIALYALPSGRRLGDVIMGLIFWCQHEYNMTNMYVSSLFTYGATPLHDFLKMVYSRHPAIVKNTFSEMSESKSTHSFLQHVKTCFQEELRENDFLKHTLRYFRSWPTIQRLPPHIRDRSQTKTRNLHRLFQFKFKTPTP